MSAERLLRPKFLGCSRANLNLQTVRYRVSFRGGGREVLCKGFSGISSDSSPGLLHVFGIQSRALVLGSQRLRMTRFWDGLRCPVIFLAALISAGNAPHCPWGTGGSRFCYTLST